MSMQPASSITEKRLPSLFAALQQHARMARENAARGES